jgi:hypothetical protein
VSTIYIGSSPKRIALPAFAREFFCSNNVSTFANQTDIQQSLCFDSLLSIDAKAAAAALQESEKLRRDVSEAEAEEKQKPQGSPESQRFSGSLHILPGMLWLRTMNKLLSLSRIKSPAWT